MGKGRAMNRMLRTLGEWLLVLVAFMFVAARPALAQEAPVTFTAIADAYVLNGAWSGTNFGDDVWLFTRTSNNQTYDSYLKFDTSGIGSVASAKLRFNASVSANANISVTAHAVGATGWSETAITWDNRPVLGAALGSVTATGTSFLDYEIDVTNYLIAEKAAGRHLVSFALHNAQSSNQTVWARSREAGSNGPRLIITPNVRVVSLLPTVSTVTLGASTSLTLTLSSAPAADTIVPISATPAGIVSVPAQVTVPAGQSSTQVPVGTLAYGQAGISASLNGSSASAGVNVVPPPVAVTALEPATFAMTVGTSSSFTVRINAAQVADTEIALAASNPSVLQVPAAVIIPQGATSATFSLTALALGDALVTASANGTSQSSSVHVSPQPAAIVSLLPSPLPLQQGATGSLTVTINVAQEVDTTITLTNSAPEVATVPESVLIAAGAISAQIPVTAVSPGSALITASVNNTSAAATVEVTPPPPVVSAVEPATLSLPKGTPGTLRVVVSRAPNAVTPVALVSSDPAIASVPPQVNIPAGALFADFPVMPNAVGQAIITAGLNGGSASSTVTVSAAELVSLTLAPQAPVRFVGQAVGFTATGTMTDGTSEDFTARVTWSSSNPAVATINAAGLASALGAGETTIRASFTFTQVQTGQSVTVEQSTLLTVQVDLAIHTVSPASGEAGSMVTLAGSGFDPVAANNQLSLRGINNTTVPATALTATPNTITLRVPPLAETGPITLTNSRGTVQSPPFTVTREQDFQLVVSPATLTIYQGAASALQAQLSSTGTKSFTGLVTLSVQGLPAGVTASFSPAATLSAFQAGTITLTATGAAAPGNYNATVQAAFTEGGVPFLRTSPVTLSVAAATGVTGVKGRFVTPEGQGIAGVIVRADIATNPQPQTVTDAAGNFALTGLPAGAVTFRFDATPAHPLYPIWPYTTTVAANQVQVLADFTINPPPSDDKFVQINNAAQTQSITDARFPGLEIKLPAGVTITGWDGVVKTRIAVERIMPDKLPVSSPPFPMREAYQLYFGTPMGGIPSQPIPVTLPNVSEKEPGEQAEIWFFDGSPMGGSGEWKLAGMGTVSPDGKTVVSNPGVGIPRFCGVCGLLSLNCPPPPNPPQPPPGRCPKCGKPIDLFTGQELMTLPLLRLSGLTPIDTELTYNPVDAFNNRAGTVGSFGFGWVSAYDVAFLPFEGPQKRLVLPGSRFVNFISDGAGAYRPFDDPALDGAVMTPINTTANEWQLKFKDGRIWRFKPFAGVTGVIRGGPPTFVVETVDGAGNTLLISRQSNGRITAIGTPQRNVAMTYGANGFVSEMRDTAGRVVRFTYTATGRLQSITDADDKVTSFTYVGDTEIPVDAACSPQPTMGERIKSVLLPGRTTATENFYGSSRRILRQIGHDGLEHRVAYKITGACVTHLSAPGVKCTVNCPDVDSWEHFQAGWRIHGGRVVGVTVTDPSANKYSYTFNSKGLTPGYVDTEGQPSRTKFDSANRLIERTDALGRVWKYQYDEQGSLSRVIDPAGRFFDFAYDGKWNKVTKITRYLDDGAPVVMEFGYHANTGKLARSTDPTGNLTTYSYTARGELEKVTSADQRTTAYEYNAAGDLVRIIDPLGNETTLKADGAGRRITVVDALGFESRNQYNGIDQLLRQIDPLLQEVTYTYDARQRLTSVIDPRNTAVESYEYDGADRISVRLDALGRGDRYSYDEGGHLARINDRKEQVADFVYDKKERVVQARYADGNIQNRIYDVAGRLTEIREHDNSITYAYDSLDRVVAVIAVTSTGSNEIRYEYDALDRIKRRTVNSGDPAVYEYDKANRPLRITYRGRTTTYEWDGTGRLFSRVLPNGIRQAYQYDDADRIIQIQYLKPDGVIVDTLAYTYDAKGQRLSKSSGGQTTQETPIVASYDAANRLTSLSLPTQGRSFVMTYDANGNLITKTEVDNPGNSTSYTWDPRNRLKRIDGPGINAQFDYDALDRRVLKTVNGESVAYIYDRNQVIGEVAGSVLSTGFFNGLEVDEIFARYSSQESRTYLTDALRSVFAQVRDDQGAQNFYSFSPYGEVAVLGDDEGNAIQYTGRENDRTGLYFYRARYYDPVMKRFISADPIGLDGGLNFYAYVNGDPVSLSDPLGLMGRGGMPNRGGGGYANRGTGVSPNGNYRGGYTPQNPGCDGFPDFLENKCVRQCCDSHDACYDQYRCNSTSWNGNLPGGWSGPCQQCNSTAFACIAKALVICDNCPPGATTWTGAP